MHFKGLSCCCPELTQGIGTPAPLLLFYLFYTPTCTWACLDSELVQSAESWLPQQYHCHPPPVNVSLFSKGILQALLDNRFRGRKTTFYCLGEPCLDNTSLKKGAPVPALAWNSCSGGRGARRVIRALSASMEEGCI